MQPFLNLYGVRISHSPDPVGEEVIGVSDRFAEERRQGLIRAGPKGTGRHYVWVGRRLCCAGPDDTER